MKKIVSVIVCMFLICSMWVMNINSPLKSLKKSEIYINYNSSNAEILHKDSFFYLIRTGECCVIEDDNFNVQDFFAEFNSTIVFEEEIENGTNYYGYTSSFKNSKIINGNKINLQVFVEEKIIVGSPIIYGSY